MIADREKIGSVGLVIAIDAAATDETAFYFADDGGTMVIGDVLINLEPNGFSLLPLNYCGDQKAMRRSFRRPLKWVFERLFFPQGTPILAAGKEQLETQLR